MVPWSLLDTAAVPGGDEALRLLRRGAEFSIMLGRNELMNSRRSSSEETLALLAAERLAGRHGLRILIGGLGMGFTLRAALRTLAPDGRIDVAELVPAVIAWARGPMAELFGACLSDRRVTLHQGDVAHLIRAGRSAYDAILLDVDNGPEGLTRAANDGLYTGQGLAATLAALRSGGVLAVWSAERSERFTQRLRATGFGVEEIAVRANGKRGARHAIWIATRDGGPNGPPGRPGGERRPPPRTGPARRGR